MNLGLSLKEDEEMTDD